MKSAFFRSRAAYGLILCGALAGCATGSLVVSQPAKKSVVGSVQIQSAGDSADPRLAQIFGSRLSDDLFHSKVHPFNPGSDLTVSYRFVQANAGNRALRYLVGFGAGKGSVTVEVSFRLKDGTDAGTINVGGQISMGLVGGDFDTAVLKAADEAATYISNNFG